VRSKAPSATLIEDKVTELPLDSDSFDPAGEPGSRVVMYSSSASK
jgi:hypothetical protein